MYTHSETTTGTREHSGGEMGWGGKENVVGQKTEGKIHQGERMTIGAVGLRGGGGRVGVGNRGIWTGTEGAVALPSCESLLRSPGGHGTGGKYRTKKANNPAGSPPDYHSRDKVNTKGGKFSIPRVVSRAGANRLLCPFLSMPPHPSTSSMLDAPPSPTLH